MNSRMRCRPLGLLVIGLSVLFALAASGCLWGIVKDAETGEPIVGAEVTYLDVNGATGTATTNANGIYAFDQATVPIPAAGPVSFNVKAVGYQPQTAARLVEYNDSNGTLANLSSFWEVQHFNMTSAGMKISTAELVRVDFDEVKAPPSIPGAYADFRLTIKVYGAADPVNPSCEQTSAPMGLAFHHPVPVYPLGFGCVTPGRDLLVSVAVTVERVWPSGGGWLAEDDTSTTTTDWITSTSDWQEIELDSTDSSGPDDSDLEFHATVRYRTSTIVPLRCEE
jgi:hypothetical protein